MDLRKEIPGWIVILVVLATAAATAWAMLQNSQNQGWVSDPSNPYPPRDMARLFSPGVDVLESNMVNVVARTGPPIIRAGSVAPHGIRGVCTSCHTVVGRAGTPVPNISADATMNHEFRGVCSNCHQIVPSVNLAVQPNAEVELVRPQQQLPSPPMVQQPLAQNATKTPTEGEWLGLEVAPLTKLTASQYSIPEGVAGLVVPEAEAQAAQAGIRAGDVIVSVGGMPITNLTDFFRATQNGTLSSAEVEILRRGERLRVLLPGQTNGGVQPQTWRWGPGVQGSIAPPAANNALVQNQGSFAPGPPTVGGGTAWQGAPTGPVFGGNVTQQGLGNPAAGAPGQNVRCPTQL